jgi:hypothetical protein
MRAIVLLLCVCASSAWGSTIPLIPPPNITLTGSGYVTTGAVTLGEVAAATEMRAAVGAGTTAIAATMTLGEGAAAVALAVLRATPAIATATSLAYLAQIGIRKCLDGSWCSSQKSPSAGDAGFDGWAWGYGDGNGNTFYAESPLSACKSNGIVGTGEATFVSVSQVSDSLYSCVGRRVADGSSAVWSTSRASFCVKNYVQSAGACVPDPSIPGSPATDADWNKGLSYPLPYGVANDLAAAKAPIPVKITVDPSPKTVNLSDPYIDPVTGKRYRDIAVVTPNSDNKTATLTTAKQEVDANGNPVTDPATGGGKPPEKQDDPCAGHETRMGCIEQGQIPDGPDLKEQKINVAITPDGGWGSNNASCPADLTATLHGLPIALSFKPVCDGVDMMRPVIIACAWLGAALIVIGASRKGEE